MSAEEDLCMVDEDEIVRKNLSLLLSQPDKGVSEDGQNEQSWVHMKADRLCFMSHISVHETTDELALPKNVRLYKKEAKLAMSKYKKAECERRRRYRKRRKDILSGIFLKHTRESRRIQAKIMNEISRTPPNMEKIKKLEKRWENHREKTHYDLMLKEAIQELLNKCVICKKLYLKVNLFWGLTLCDECYFQPEYIKRIMTSWDEIHGKSNDDDKLECEAAQNNFTTSTCKKQEEAIHNIMLIKTRGKKKRSTMIPLPPPISTPIRNITDNLLDSEDSQCEPPPNPNRTLLFRSIPSPDLSLSSSSSSCASSSPITTTNIEVEGEEEELWGEGEEPPNFDPTHFFYAEREDDFSSEDEEAFFNNLTKSFDNDEYYNLSPHAVILNCAKTN